MQRVVLTNSHSVSSQLLRDKWSVARRPKVQPETFELIFNITPYGKIFISQFAGIAFEDLRVAF